MDELAAAEIIARTIVPWNEVCKRLGVHDRLLRQLCADSQIPEIRFSQRSRGILLDDIDRLIAAHAQLKNHPDL